MHVLPSFVLRKCSLFFLCWPNVTNRSKPHLPKLQIWDSNFHSQKQKQTFQNNVMKSLVTSDFKSDFASLWNTEKVASRSTSRLVANLRFMKGKFDPYVLWPLAKRIQNWISDQSTTRDFTVVINIHDNHMIFFTVLCNNRAAKPNQPAAAIHF